jgi:glucose uptake protein GlcU
MFLSGLLIKVLLLVPSVIFIFYGVLYTVLAELNVRAESNRFYRTAGLIFLVVGTSLLIIYAVA